VVKNDEWLGDAERCSGGIANKVREKSPCQSGPYKSPRLFRYGWAGAFRGPCRHLWVLRDCQAVMSRAIYWICGGELAVVDLVKRAYAS
jgi:hypothetical protein